MKLCGFFLFLAGESLLASSESQTDGIIAASDVSLLQASLEVQQPSDDAVVWSSCFQRERGHSNREYCDQGNNDDCIRAYCQNLGLEFTGQWEHCADSWFGWWHVATRGRCASDYDHADGWCANWQEGVSCVDASGETRVDMNGNPPRVDANGNCRGLGISYFPDDSITREQCFRHCDETVGCTTATYEADGNWGNECWLGSGAGGAATGFHRAGGTNSCYTHPDREASTTVATTTTTTTTALPGPVTPSSCCNTDCQFWCSQDSCAAGADNCQDKLFVQTAAQDWGSEGSTVVKTRNNGARGGTGGLEVTFTSPTLVTSMSINVVAGCMGQPAFPQLSHKVFYKNSASDTSWTETSTQPADYTGSTWGVVVITDVFPTTPVAAVQWVPWHCGRDNEYVGVTLMQVEGAPA